MPGQLIDYIRVSSSDQNPERQLENIEGNIVVFHSMDRLAREFN